MLKLTLRADFWAACLIAVGPALAAAAFAAAPPKPTYTYQSLGTLGGASSTAEGLNDAGDVVGVSQLADGSSSPFVYSAAEGMRDLNRITDSPLDVPGQPVFGPDGRLYVVNNGLYRGAGSVSVFNPADGLCLGEFVPLGSGGLDRPAVLTFGPDGHLYVPTYSPGSAYRDRIAKYDGTSGAYLGDFVASGQGGVTGITWLEFGPDLDGDGHQDLFASSANADEILVFSGADGASHSVFVAAGAGGLDSPNRMLFRDLDQNGTSELLVCSGLSATVLVYDGWTGEYLYQFAAAPTLPNRLTDMQYGPDGHLYVTARPSIGTIDGTDDQAQVLRFDGTTGTFIDVFVPPHAGGWSSAAPRLTFDAAGQLYVSSGDTNQILRFEGPNSPSPGAFIDVFVEGVGFVLSTARDINATGQIAGLGYPLGRRNIFGNPGVYRYTPAAAGELVGRVDDLNVPGLNFEEEATAINDSGDVAGHFLSADDNAFHAFLWTESAGAVDLGTLAGQDTFVTALSNRSGGHVQITGYASTSSGYRAWRYNTATGTMQNLGLLSGSAGYSRAWDINSAGTAVGSASKSGKQHAFLRTLSGSMTDLGTLGGYTSYAAGINDLQSVVGTSDTSTRSSLNRFQAFLRTTTHGMFKLEPQITNLPTSLRLKIRPNRISNTGLICGPGALDPAGTAFLLIPQ